VTKIDFSSSQLPSPSLGPVMVGRGGEQHTSAQPHTLTPKWEEDLIVAVTSCNSDVLKLTFCNSISNSAGPAQLSRWSKLDI
jgi:hypothetical protein